MVVGIAYVVAAGIAYAGAKAGLYQATGQATAILIVLMFGAGTDYCLLVLSRYREELANETEDPMGTALKRTTPAIVSAGGIVVVVMLVLSVADYNATRWMGPVLAIGTAVTVLAGITLLPAILAALPANAFRASKTSTLWPRIGRVVRSRPVALTAAVLAVLIAGALGNLKDRETLDFAEQFRSTPESVTGLHRLQEKFPPGQAGPVDILIDQTRALDLAAAAGLRRRLQRRSRRLLAGTTRPRSSASPSTRTRSPSWRPTRSRSCGPTRDRSARPRWSAARRPRCSTRRPPCTATRG